MQLDTPYWSRPSGEQAQELACMRAVLTDAAPPGLIYEAFGGIGMTAELMSQLWPKARIRSFEIDTQCAAMYRARRLPHAQIFLEDARLGLQGLTRFEGASLDFNRFTMLDLTRTDRGAFQRFLLSAVAQARPRWIQLTDSAVSHLHLNYGLYGLKRSDWDDYVKALSATLSKVIQYQVVRSAHHRRASYLRLEPVDAQRHV